jgi:type II secretory pathway component PulF
VKERGPCTRCPRMIMAVVIGGMAAAMYRPMFDMIQTAQT